LSAAAATLGRLSRAIRIGIPVAALAALGLGIFLPTAHELPSLALGNRELLWAERTLVFFYGFLLFFVPIVKALQGELPIELSTRGARYAEASDRAVEELDARLTEAERILDETVDFVDDLADRVS
jgi:hypothetical protein